MLERLDEWRLTLLGYRLLTPEKCCGNCAFCSLRDGRSQEFMNTFSCAYMDATVPGLSFYMMTDRCGVCRKWTPRLAAVLAKESGSYDEFRLKMAAAGLGDAATPEFDDMFAERKATEKQIRAVTDNLHAVERNGELLRPVMAVRENIMDFGFSGPLTTSTSFYTLYGWISKYSELLESPAGRLSDFMI